MGNWFSSNSQETPPKTSEATKDDSATFETDFEVIKDFLAKYMNYHRPQRKANNFIDQLKPLTFESMFQFMQNFKGSQNLAHQSLSNSRALIDILEKQCLQQHSEILTVLLKDQKAEQLLKDLETQEINQSSVNDDINPENQSEIAIHLSDGSIKDLKSCLELYSKKIHDNEGRLQLEELCFRAAQRLKRINDNNMGLIRVYKGVVKTTESTHETKV